MIPALLLDTARVVRRHRSGLCLLMLLAGAASARAQSAGGGYLPSGAGTFVPYSGGGSLGVMPSGPVGPATTLTVPSRPMGLMPGSAALGLRDGVNALRPIGTRRGMASSPMIGRPAAMKPMPRRPVGSYPFRVPPSLRGAPAQRPAMAM